MKKLTFKVEHFTVDRPWWYYLTSLGLYVSFNLQPLDAGMSVSALGLMVDVSYSSGLAFSPCGFTVEVAVLNHWFTLSIGTTR